MALAKLSGGWLLIRYFDKVSRENPWAKPSGGCWLLIGHYERVARENMALKPMMATVLEQSSVSARLLEMRLEKALGAASVIALDRPTDEQ
jgi:hypothetical protein